MTSIAPASVNPNSMPENDSGSSKSNPLSKSIREPSSRTFVTIPVTGVAAGTGEVYNRCRQLQRQPRTERTQKRQGVSVYNEIRKTVPSHFVSSRRPSRSCFSKPRQYSTVRDTRRKVSIKSDENRNAFRRSKSNCTVGGSLLPACEARVQIPKNLRVTIENKTGDFPNLSDASRNILHKPSPHNPNCLGCQNYQHLLSQAYEIGSSKDKLIRSQRQELDFFAGYCREITNLLQQHIEKPAPPANCAEESNVCGECGCLIDDETNAGDELCNEYETLDSVKKPFLNESTQVASKMESAESMKEYLRDMQKQKSKRLDPNQPAFHDSEDEMTRRRLHDIPEADNDPNQPRPAKDVYEDFDIQALTKAEMKSEIITLRIAVAARHSLLYDLQSRIRKANQILNHRFSALMVVPDLTISSVQYQEILTSHQKLVRWLKRYIVRGLEDIVKLENLNISQRTNDSQHNYYIETTVPIDGIDTTGVFIPVPPFIYSPSIVVPPTVLPCQEEIRKTDESCLSDRLELPEVQLQDQSTQVGVSLTNVVNLRPKQINLEVPESSAAEPNEFSTSKDLQGCSICVETINSDISQHSNIEFTISDALFAPSNLDCYDRYAVEPERLNSSPRSSNQKTCAAVFPAFTSTNFQQTMDDCPKTEEIFRRSNLISENESKPELDADQDPNQNHLSSLVSIFPGAQNQNVRSSRARTAVTEEDLRYRMGSFKNLIKQYKEETLNSIQSDVSNESDEESVRGEVFGQLEGKEEGTGMHPSNEKFDKLIHDVQTGNEEQQHFRKAQSSRLLNEAVFGLGLSQPETSKVLIDNSAAEPECCLKITSKQPGLLSNSDPPIANFTFVQGHNQDSETETAIAQMAKTDKKLSHAANLSGMVSSLANILNPFIEDYYQPEDGDNLLKDEVEDLRKQLSGTQLSVKKEDEPSDKLVIPVLPNSAQGCPFGFSKIPVPKSINRKVQLAPPPPEPKAECKDKPVPSPRKAIPRLVSFQPPASPREISSKKEKEQDSPRSKQASSGQKRCNASFNDCADNSSKWQTTSNPASPRTNPNPLNPNLSLAGTSYTTEYGASYNRYGWKRST